MMIKIFYGEDRVRAQAEIRKFLGREYEVVEGANLNPQDLPSLLMGGSLLSGERAILIRDGLANKAVGEKLLGYLNSPHRVVFLETKLDKRSSAYKAIKGQVELREFTLPKDPNAGVVFDIYKTAKRDGKQAVRMVEKIEQTQDPMMFLGLMVAEALRDFKMRRGAEEKKALRELSRLDLELKSSAMQPWLLIKSCLMRLS